MASTINATTTNGVAVTGDTSGSLALQTNNGTTAVTIDTSQNVGIGTTSPGSKFVVEVPGTASYSTSGQPTPNVRIKTDGSANSRYTSLQIECRGTAGQSQANYITSVPEATDGNASLAFATYGSFAVAERMRIDSSGNVGIGTTGPSYKLDVAGQIASQDAYLITANSSGTPSAGAFIFRPASNTIALGTASTERMRITDAGEVWVARTTDAGAYNLQCGGTGVWGAGAYVNGSDARIKEDIQPISSSLDVVNKLNPVTFKYKEDWSKDQNVQTGFIAQELQETLKDEIYLEGIVNTGGEYLSVAYQNIIPLLTKSIQELKAIVDAQQQEINALKGEA